MTHASDHFLTWLRDAHAMEVQATSLLRTQIGRIESYPDLKARLEEHLSETEKQVEALKALLARSVAGNSILKDFASRLTAAAHSVGAVLSGDEVIRATMSAYTFEHSEIATYRVLIAAADELGDLEARAVFEHILEEERRMADWLEAYLDSVTSVYLMRDERNLQAKR